MSDELNERYIAIARACLKAINTAPEQGGDRAGQIQHVYQAIEQAFQEQTAPLEQQNRTLSAALQRIAENSLSREEMVQHAQAALNRQNDSGSQSPLH